MIDIATFARDCLTSGAIFTSLCALLIVPFLVVIISRALAPRIARMHDDPLWQAPLAAAAAALPGTVFISIAAYGLIAGWGSTCMEFVTGRILYAAIALVTVIALVRASIAVARELSQLRDLLCASRPASLCLTPLAREAGVRVREVDIDTPFCALAGVLRPVVLVSSGTLHRLSDAQLAAALKHEAAHDTRYDGLISLALLFLSRLFPVSVAALPDVYRAAREAAADQIALRSADPLDLAGAITVMARSRYAAAAALSGDGEIRARVQVLLADDPYAAGSGNARAAALGALVFTALLGFAPLWMPALHLFSCNGAMPQ